MIINNIDKLTSEVDYSKKALADIEIKQEFIDRRYIATVPCNEIGDNKELLYYSKLEKIIKDENLKTKSEGGIIYNLNSNNELSDLYVFKVVDMEEENESEYINVLKAGRYLIANYKKENEEEQVEKLHKYIKENDLKVNRFIEADLFNDVFSTDSYSSQIQAYVE